MFLEVNLVTLIITTGSGHNEEDEEGCFECCKEYHIEFVPYNTVTEQVSFSVQVVRKVAIWGSTL